MCVIAPLSGPEIAVTDLAAIERLHAASFDEPWTGEAFQGVFGLPGTFLLCARMPEGEVMGFVLARVAADEGEILTIAVDPAHRRGHIGQRLMEAAIAEASARGAVTLFLEVADDNDPALKLYARLGFKVAGRRANYYARPTGLVDARVMSLALAKA